MTDDIDDQTRENAVNAIAEVWYEHTTGILDPDQLEDAMVQAISEAADICADRGIPKEDLVEVVGDGIEQGMIRKVDDGVSDLRSQLEASWGDSASETGEVEMSDSGDLTDDSPHYVWGVYYLAPGHEMQERGIVDRELFLSLDEARGKMAELRNGLSDEQLEYDATYEIRGFHLV